MLKSKLDSSLFARISLVFLVILLTLGLLTFWVSHRNAKEYYLEFSQKLNKPIAMYIARNANLVREGKFNVEALLELAPHIMMINPSVEVYLLDGDGKIIIDTLENGHNIAQLSDRLNRVSLEPIHDFLGPNPILPILGDNPQQIDTKRIFSAWPLYSASEKIGFVYVVLAGEKHQSLLSSVATSYSFKNLSLTLVGVLLLASISGIVLFFMLTRRLVNLTRRVKMWQQGTVSIDRALADPAQHTSDELEELARTYDEMALKLVEQYEKLQESDKNRREFIANISHDLRTPLTTLQSYLETLTLKGNTLSADQKLQYASIAHKQSQRLGMLIDELFELTKLNSGEIKPKIECFSLLEVAIDIQQDFAIQARNASIDLYISPQRDPIHQFNVYADLAMIHRVFENLLANAIRYTPEYGYIQITVERMKEEFVSVKVSDSGPGLAPEDIERVFDRHYTKSKKAKGEDSVSLQKHAGLGLSIVESILRLHGTEVEVVTDNRRGLTVQFELPVCVMITAALADKVGKVDRVE